jgi:hypothetical protein
MRARLTGWRSVMSDAVDYLRAYAVRAICKARRMPFGRSKRLQRAVGRIYLLLTKEAAVAPNVDHLDDFRAARQVEESIATQPGQRPETRKISAGLNPPRSVHRNHLLSHRPPA